MYIHKQLLQINSRKINDPVKKRARDKQTFLQRRHNNCNYVSYIQAPQYIKQKLTDIKGKIDSNTIILGDVNTSFTPMDRSSKQN